MSKVFSENWQKTYKFSAENEVNVANAVFRFRSTVTRRQSERQKNAMRQSFGLHKIGMYTWDLRETRWVQEWVLSWRRSLFRRLLFTISFIIGKFRRDAQRKKANRSTRKRLQLRSITIFSNDCCFGRMKYKHAKYCDYLWHTKFAWLHVKSSCSRGIMNPRKLCIANFARQLPCFLSFLFGVLRFIFVSSLIIASISTLFVCAARRAFTVMDVYQSNRTVFIHFHAVFFIWAHSKFFTVAEWNCSAS